MWFVYSFFFISSCLHLFFLHFTVPFTPVESPFFLHNHHCCNIFTAFDLLKQNENSFLYIFTFIFEKKKSHLNTFYFSHHFIPFFCSWNSLHIPRLILQPFQSLTVFFPLKLLTPLGSVIETRKLLFFYQSFLTMYQPRIWKTW